MRCDIQYHKNSLIWLLGLAMLLCLLCLPAKAEEIDLDIIAYIESSDNALAYNKTTQATGLYQITPICLADYNQYHKQKYKLSDMYKPDIAYIVASWYMNIRIPQMLRYYNKPIIIDNILTSYNVGISYVVKNKQLPMETINYIKKYKGLRG